MSKPENKPNPPSTACHPGLRALVMGLAVFTLAACSHPQRASRDPLHRQASAPSGIKSWNVPGTYHWIVPPGDAGGMIQVQVIGAAGGGGNVGWVRLPGAGDAYTCSFERDCAGAGGGGGGASALMTVGHALVVAAGGGGGGGSVNAQGSVRGGSGGMGQMRSTMIRVVSNAQAAAHCRETCVYAGETLTLIVGAGGLGAQGPRGGSGGLGYDGRGGNGGNRCGLAGTSGGAFGGGGGGGAACHWGQPGGAGGPGAYGGGGGAGTLEGTNCIANGGAGGNQHTAQGPSGSPGACGGGPGGDGHASPNSFGVNGSLPGHGSINGGAGQRGHNGSITLIWS